MEWQLDATPVFSMSSPYQQNGPAGRSLQDVHYRIAAPYFLDSQPLTWGLDSSPQVRLSRAAPSRMLQRLHWDQADVALVPIIDLQRSEEPLVVIPAGCVASAGPSMTMQLFSRVRPEKLRVFWADTDARTTTALTRLLWSQTYHRDLEVIPFQAGSQLLPQDADAVLLVGDKLAAFPPSGWEWQMDLGSMWFELTGLPMVYGIWAAREEADFAAVHEVLSEARRGGQRNLEEIARRHGPELGWDQQQAVKYLTKHLQFECTDAHFDGIEEFFDRADECGLLPDYHPLHFYKP